MIVCRPMIHCILDLLKAPTNYFVKCNKILCRNLMSYSDLMRGVVVGFKKKKNIMCVCLCIDMGVCARERTCA